MKRDRAPLELASVSKAGLFCSSSGARPARAGRKSKMGEHLGFDKRFRLRRGDEFKLVRSTGRSWSHPLLVLFARPNDLERSRVGFSVSKRVGKAVKRNRVKRLLRETVRLRLPEMQPGRDLVFIARAPITMAAFGQVDAAVAQLLQRSGMLRRAPAASKEGQAEAAEVASPPAGGNEEGAA